MYSVDTQLLYIAAFRYALGRRTYVVPVVAANIRNAINLLTDNTKALIVREIKECQYLGDDCDAEIWLSLARFLSEVDDG